MVNMCDKETFNQKKEPKEVNNAQCVDCCLFGKKENKIEVK